MSNTFNPPPISQVLKQTKEGHERTLAYVEKTYADRVKAVEDNYRLLPLLEAEGVEKVKFYSYCMDDLTIDLGEMPTKGREAKEAFAKKVRAVRRAVGCSLKEHHREPLEEVKKEGPRSKTVQKFVKVFLSPEDYPRVSISYVAKLGRASKCKIVKTRRVVTDLSLVCEV